MSNARLKLTRIRGGKVTINIRFGNLLNFTWLGVWDNVAKLYVDGGRHGCGHDGIIVNWW